jgi:hypothetical protein
MANESFLGEERADGNKSKKSGGFAPAPGARLKKDAESISPLTQPTRPLSV